MPAPGWWPPRDRCSWDRFYSGLSGRRRTHFAHTWVIAYDNGTQLDSVTVHYEYEEGSVSWQVKGGEVVVRRGSDKFSRVPT